MADARAIVPGRISVIIVNYDGEDFIELPLRSLREQTWPDVETIVVDNASHDRSPEIVAERFPEVRLLRMRDNPGFAGGNNRGVSASTGELVMLLNPDAWLEPDGLSRLAAMLDDPSIGVAGGTVRHEDGRVQEVGNMIDRMGFPVPRRGDLAGSVDRGAFFVGGCAMMMRRRDWDRLGGFDDRFFMFFEEVDLCWRAKRAGLDIAVDPAVTVWHLGGATLEGGYARDGKHQTNPLRIYLRERNTLASVIRNGDAGTIGWAVGAWALNVGEAIGFALMGEREVARQYPRALAWNIRNLRGTLALRRAGRSGRVRPDRSLTGWARGSGKLRLLRASGVPVVRGGTP